MPMCEPTFCTVGAWSRESLGFVMKVVSRCGIGVRAQPEEDFAGVVHVAVVVHDDDVFAEHHLAHAPEAVHDLEGLLGVLFADADEDEVVENAFGRERDIDDLREVHFEDRQENPDAGVAHVEILHRRNADDRGGIDRVLAGA